MSIKKVQTDTLWKINNQINKILYLKFESQFESNNWPGIYHEPSRMSVHIVHKVQLEQTTIDATRNN
jgi:hypothetical protein